MARGIKPTRKLKPVEHPRHKGGRAGHLSAGGRGQGTPVNITFVDKSTPLAGG